MDITKKDTRGLIEMYWERKCLWQVNHEDYKNSDAKRQAYREIAMFLRSIGVKDVTVKMIRDKIQNLRRAMRKEKKKVDATGGAYCPTLWYYDLLSFLNGPDDDNYDSIIINDQIIDLEDDSNGFAGHFISCTVQEPPKVPQKRPRKEKNKPTREPSPDGSESSDNKLSTLTGKPNEFQAMGINFAAKIKRMDITQQIYAELLIQKVIAKGLLGRLNETTEILDFVPDDKSN